MKRWNIPKKRLDELIAVGMHPFDVVFNIYVREMHHLIEEEGHFYQYFMWWVRWAISRYVYPDAYNDEEKSE